MKMQEKFVSTSPFVMPNSYFENTKKGFDGESMSDWFTGSGCVLLKIFLWCVFGVRATLDGIEVKHSNCLPFDKAESELTVRAEDVCLRYEKGDCKVVCYRNGQPIA